MIQTKTIHLSRLIRGRVARAVAFVMLGSLVVMSIPFRPAVAANLTLVRDYLSRQQAGVVTGIQHDIFFTATTAVSGGTGTNKIIVTLPNSSANNTKWCRSAGSLTVTGITNTTGVATSEGATILPGSSLQGTCTQSSPDTFTITGVDNLSAGVRYGVRFVGNVAVLGTGDAGNDIKILIKTNNGTSDVDQFTVATSLRTDDSYVVSANIDATLTVALSATTLNLGILDATHINYQGVTSTVSTSAENGYISLVSYSGAMTNGVDTIADSGTSVTKGTSGFGAATSKAAQTIATDNTSLPNCSATQGSSTAGPFNASSLTTSFQQFSSSSTNITSDVTTLCFLGAVSGTQAPGSYSTVVTLVTTAKF